MVIKKKFIIIIIIIIIITVQPRSVLGSFDVVFMSCKVNFQVVRSALQKSMCTLRLSSSRSYVGSWIEAGYLFMYFINYFSTYWINLYVCKADIKFLNENTLLK